MQSSSMRQLDRLVRVLAAKEVGVTLVGESGSGKEVLARRVHDLSHRRTGPFVPINCAAIPEPLFESELFGHEKGAFTGASARARGKIEASQGGTLFLDEIGDMPMALQAKLLRFLENRKFMRVGGTTKINVDSRLICATLRPLDEEVRAGRFRADLYYRIQGVSLKVPPLRDRRPDIAPLVHQFVAQISAKHGIAAPKIGRAAMAVLREYDWPGNVRELRNVIELVSLLRAGSQVRIRDLPPALQEGIVSNGGRRVSPAWVSKDIIQVGLDRPLEDIIDQVLHAVLELEGGNRSHAAHRLGISLRTVQRHLARQ
ncbi:MAG TPA: sigma-54 dependent transcriptional regulator [Polyangiaceae bacterium]